MGRYHHDEIAIEMTAPAEWEGYKEWLDELEAGPNTYVMQEDDPLAQRFVPKDEVEAA